MHLVNCVALAYVPFMLTYRLSGLSDHGAFWKCAQSAGYYTVCQLGKMLFLATFVVDSVPLYGEALKHSLDILDLIVMHAAMNRIGVSGDLRFLVTGFGWATAELICTRLVPFWIGARGVEFSWKYVQLALESNISLALHLSTAMLLSQWKASGSGNRSRVLTIILLALCYRAALFDMVGTFDAWTLLGVKAALGTVVGLGSLRYTLTNNHKGYSNVFH